MREIKFRAYNHTTKEMMFSEKLTTETVGFLLENHRAYIENDKPDKVFSPVMLYTGVDDCDGVNIYDNDTLSIQSIDSNDEMVLGDVVWDFDSWQIKDGGMLNSFKKMKIKVAGNLYSK